MNTLAPQKSFLVMAGGTGGHVYPALSVAAELKSRGHQVVWLGTGRGIEARLVPAANIELHQIDVFGLRGKGWKALLAAPFNLVRAVFQSRRIIRELSPAVLIGFGGFVAGPGGVAAKTCKVPLVIHEQNARAGTTNKLLARIANRVLAAFPEALPGAEVVGNPVRTELVRLDRPENRMASKEGSLRLLIVGGSLGAVYLNETVAQALALLNESTRPVVRHQCGEKWLEECRSSYAKNAVSAEVVPYIEDMTEAYAWADFMICRAGAMTVSEVAAVGIPALFIPFPFAIDDHQTANALWLVDQQAARLVQQSELTPERLKSEIVRFLQPREQLAAMGEKARAMAITKATVSIADVCEELAHVA